MITKIADNILSPIGLSSDDNFTAVLSGRSELKFRDNSFGVHEGFCGSLFERDMICSLFEERCGNGNDYSFFEKLCILSSSQAIDDCRLNACSSDVVFVFSTTKGNVDKLEYNLNDDGCYISRSAQQIVDYFGNPNILVIASNACISGVCAQIAAVRALINGRYRYAVVIGCDVLSKFIVSGFQSFKALSMNPCMPYDKNRDGLNLGEAAGTIVLSANENDLNEGWRFKACSIHNDANHISGPSRVGEGSYRVISDILRTVDPASLSFLNTHGTATPYNDEMESIAIHRSGLDKIPVTGLKGYFGHTLGAAGIIETILSMKAVDNNVVLPTRGYSECGTTYTLDISNNTRYSDKKSFIKILSGFGGSNAGIAYEKILY